MKTAGRTHSRMSNSDSGLSEEPEQVLRKQDADDFVAVLANHGNRE